MVLHPTTSLWASPLYGLRVLRAAGRSYA